jgi:hypothetical protein
MAILALGLLMRRRLRERKASAISGSIRLRERRAFFIQRGGIFARYFR